MKKIKLSVAMAIITTCMVEGFRRAGEAHSITPTAFAPGHFDQTQFDALNNEPKLVVIQCDVKDVNDSMRKVGDWKLDIKESAKSTKNKGEGDKALDSGKDAINQPPPDLLCVVGAIVATAPHDKKPNCDVLIYELDGKNVTPTAAERDAGYAWYLENNEGAN